MLQIKEYVKVSSLEEAYVLNQKRNNVVIGGMHWLKKEAEVLEAKVKAHLERMGFVW